MANKKVSKRKDYLSWDEYFMGITLLSAQRSKDPSTQLGACIVNSEKKIMGIGYNGFPIGCSDDLLPWARDGEYLKTKYPYVCHAELNAILNSRTLNLLGCTIYIGLFPCNECTKLIIQAGIKEVVYLSNKYSHMDSYKASVRMLKMAQIKIRQFKKNAKRISLDFQRDSQSKS